MSVGDGSQHTYEDNETLLRDVSRAKSSLLDLSSLVKLGEFVTRDSILCVLPLQLNFGFKYVPKEEERLYLMRATES